jgi:hypothetical protein
MHGLLDRTTQLINWTKDDGRKGRALLAFDQEAIVNDRIKRSGKAS